MPNYTYFFERYIGRKLKSWERNIIAPLERARQHALIHRALIIDPPGQDARPLLVHWTRFVKKHINQNIEAAIIGQKKKEIIELAHFSKKQDNDWLHIGMYARPNNLRGFSFSIALIFDADKANPDLLQSAIITLNGPPGNNPHSFVVIHAKNAKPSFLPQAFCTLPRLESSSNLIKTSTHVPCPDKITYPLISIVVIETAVIIMPQRAFKIPCNAVGDSAPKANRRQEFFDILFLLNKNPTP